MKAQRRHELQRNALEVEILKVWEFLRRRGNYLAWGALGAAAIVLAVVWYTKRAAADVETTQAKFTRSMSMAPSEERMQGLSDVAAKTSHPFWASQATVQLGFDLSVILVQRWPDLGDVERMDLRRRSEAYFQQTITEFPKEALAVAKAHYGLAKLAESWGELDQARVEYETILREAQTADGLKGQPVVFLARDGLTRLPLLQAKVYMPSSAPASGPSTHPAGAASAPATSATAESGPGASAGPSAGEGAAGETTPPAVPPSESD